MKSLPIQASTDYCIYIEHKLLQTPLLATHCKKLNKRPVIITDTNLIELHGKKLQQTLQHHGLTAGLLAFPAGEVHKTREMKQWLEDELLKQHYGRDSCFIALGGGVVSDLVGFLGATYCRGVPVIYAPTSLLAMVDASIGGKTGVNTAIGKNLIGTFTQPTAVFIDTHTLDTLPYQEWHNGFSEMIKHSLLANAPLFYLLKQQSSKIKHKDSDFLIEMIYQSCLIKKNYVEQDEHEQGIRQLLNFGHTIGHAIETIAHYQISHGEAVAIGMLVEAYLSIQYGCLEQSVLPTLEAILRDYELPLKTNAFNDKTLFLTTLMLDKKSRQTIPQIVLLDDIGKPHQEGHCFTVAFDSQQLEHALDWALEKFAP